MAESYVTKFTKYVKDCNDNLYNILKNKKVQVVPNDTLSVLVNKVNNIDTVYPTYPQYYERDPGLPNIDELFDNDPLRKVNGGEYPYCAYYIVLLDANNKVGIYDQYMSNQTYSADKIVVSDGKTYENITATIKEAYEVQSNGIYTDSEGLKYCLVKFYKNTVVPSASSGYLGIINTVELIEDRTHTLYSTNDSVTYVTGVTNRTPHVNYIRFELSNVSKGTNTGTASSVYLYPSVLVVNGMCNNTYIQTSGTDKIIMNCNITYSSATSISFSLYGSRCGSYIKLPTSDVPLTVSINNIIADTLICNNSITSIKFSGYAGTASDSITNSIKTLSVGNGMTSWFTSSAGSNGHSSLFLSVKNLSIAQDAFSQNTSAVTVDFGYTYLNKECVLELFNKLADRTGKTANKLKLHNYSKSLVTDEEKAILTNKNWTIG